MDTSKFTKPVAYCEHLQLSSIGIQPDLISFQILTLQSDRFLCVREKVNVVNKVVIIDLAEDNNVSRMGPTTSDSFIMHPKQKILASKAHRRLRIINVQTQANATVKSHIMDEDVVFWKWTSDTIIAIVTDSSVYHWTIADRASPPQKIFDRDASLSSSQIINYRMTPDAKWSVLIGIAYNGDNPIGFNVDGSMQLYSKEMDVSYSIKGHTAAFAELRLEDGQSPTKLFTFAVRTATGAELHVVEMDHHPLNPVFQTLVVDVYCPADANDDFPVSMHVSKRHGIIYLISKHGLLHLYDLETGACIYADRTTNATVLVTAEHEATDGVIGVNKKGQVFSVSIDNQNIIPYILSTLNNTKLALKLASRANIPGTSTDDLYVRHFQQLFHNEQYGEAAKMAATSPNGILRTMATIKAFKAAPTASGELSLVLQYFMVLLEAGELDKLESIEFARPVLLEGQKQLLQKWLTEDKLYYSEELGDIVRMHDTTLALSIYRRADIHKKVVECFAETDQMDQITSYSAEVGYSLDYAGLLQHIMRVTPQKAAEFTRQMVNDESVPLVDIERVMDVFMGTNI